MKQVSADRFRFDAPLKSVRLTCVHRTLLRKILISRDREDRDPLLDTLIFLQMISRRKRLETTWCHLHLDVIEKALQWCNEARWSGEFANATSQCVKSARAKKVRIGNPHFWTHSICAAEISINPGVHFLYISYYNISDEEKKAKARIFLVEPQRSSFS